RLDYNVLGHAVTLAQRLEAAAPGGETYTGDWTYRMAHDRFVFELVGAVQAKNTTDPLIAWRLVGERTREEARLARGRPVLVDREHARSQIALALESARAGTGSVITIAGEPGIGKTHLADHVRGDGGTFWLHAACAPYGSATAYGPYLALLHSFAGAGAHEGPHSLATRLEDALRDAGLAENFPAFARLLGTAPQSAGDPESNRAELHEAFVRLVGHLGDRGSTAVWIEDLHWADQASIDLTVDVARTLRERPVVFVLSARPESEATLAAIRAAAPTAVGLELEAFGPEHSRSLIRQFADGEPPDDLVLLVHDRAAGNPFFVQEVVRSLLDAGTLVQRDGTWVLGPGSEEMIPPTLEELLSARIDRLTPDAKTLLGIAAVCGAEASVAVVEAMLSKDITAASRELIAAGFVEHSTAGAVELLRFRHALLRDVAYSRLLRRRRREVHGAVAIALERVFGSGDDVVGLLASHVFEAGLGHERFELLLRAGARARRLFANEDAILHYERAASIAREAPEGSAPHDAIGDIRVALADLYELTGSYERGLELYEQERNTSGAIGAWTGAARTLRKRGELDRAIALVREGLDAGEGMPGWDPVALRLEEGWSLALQGRYVEAIGALSAGLDTAGDRRDATVGHVLLRLARAETVERDLDRALVHANDARTIFEASGDPRGLIKTHLATAAALHYQGRLDDAARQLRDALELCDHTGAVDDAAGSLINLGLIELERGDVAAAIECDRRAIAAFERIGHQTGRAVGYGNLAFKLFTAGDLDEARWWAGIAIEHARAIPHPPTVADATRTLARVHAASGDAAGAAALAAQAAVLYETMGLPVEVAECRQI
ncbi:MAG: ATP-binding protein, partial [Actinomycetota bacterium]